MEYTWKSMLPSGRQGWCALAMLAIGLPMSATAALAAPAAPAAVATPSEASSPAVRSAPAAVRLLEPADGTVLAGGSTATLAWEPGPGMTLDRVEEWEAFLSLDGGSSWPIRITPHLDIALRRVTFPVPAVPSADVRLLLRIGDETEEVPFTVPGAFEIDAQASAILPAAAIRYTAGEPALPGGAGVVAWVEGTRQGGRLEPAVAVPLTTGWTGLTLVSLERHPIGAEPDPPTHELFSSLRKPTNGSVPALRPERPRPRPAPPGARAILLAIERLDE